ncbi:MAG TPA: class I SAM-dependent methyltransferase [Kofleriaceae bacterium]|nr:class I SAM-dependent methyltransferase [Kofleriaceae bacterium]
MLKALKHLARFLAYSWHAVGPRRMVGGSLRLLADPEARRADSGFDDRYGTDTNAGLTPAEAGIPSHRRRGATMYLPTLDVDLAAMLDALPWPASLRERATFVDLGSGKGRVVFLAAMLRFRQVRGVELSPILHEVAQRNHALVERSRDLQSPITLVLADAAAADIPAGPFILYLYHPFREPIAEAIMARVLASLAEAPRPAAILYGHPTLQAPLDPDVFRRGGMFLEACRGARATKRFRIGWSIWTNDAWLLHGHLGSGLRGALGAA